MGETITKGFNGHGFSYWLNDCGRVRRVYRGKNHAFITRLVNGGIAIEVAQEMAGHASISTTRRYCYVSKDRLAAAAEMAAGIA